MTPSDASGVPAQPIDLRRAALAALVTILFLVPMIPVGGAATPTSFAVKAVSGNTPGSGNAVYNITFVAQSADDSALLLDFPTGFVVHGTGVTVGGNTSHAGFNTSASPNTVNVTGMTLIKGNEYFILISGVDVPHKSGSFTNGFKAQIFDDNAKTGTEITKTITVANLDVDADIDGDFTDEMILASDATSDYYILVEGNSVYETDHEIEVKFPTGFDLSGASGTDIKISGLRATYTIQAEDDAEDGDDIAFRIRNVENPSTDEDDEVTLTVKISNDDGDEYGDGNFDVTIEATSILVSHTGGSTIVTEGEEDDDSITVKLDTEPSNDVIVNIDPGDEVELDKEKLTFKSSNWNTAQTVKITAIDDSVAEGPVLGYELIFTSESDDATYDELEKKFKIDILDDDIGIVARHLGDDTILTEGGDGEKYELLLSTEPTDSVTVSIAAAAGLAVDDDEVRFTTTNWDDPVVLEITPVREDDDAYQKKQTLIITHTAESDDADYDGEVNEFEVILKDDEHPALGITDEQIEDANKLLELDLEETDDGIELTWTLPNQTDLDDLFDTEGEVTVEGVQVLYAKSPFTLADTFDTGDDEFDDGTWVHEFDDGGSVRTKYLVTMYYQEDKGKWDENNLPDTDNPAYAGSVLREELMPWWGWLLLGLGVFLVVGLVLVAVLTSQSRQNFEDDWDEEKVAKTSKTGSKKAAKPAPPPGKGKVHELECPVCEHQFKVRGTKPLETECPSCGTKGVLN